MNKIVANGQGLGMRLREQSPVHLPELSAVTTNMTAQPSSTRAISSSTTHFTHLLIPPNLGG